MHRQLSIIFAGSGEFGLPTLRALIEAGHRITSIVSQPDKPAGRGRKLTPTAVSQLALERSLPLVRTPDINALEPPAADLMVVIAFGQKIAERVVAHPRLGSVNLHASRLPKFRGAAPIHGAILAGETVTGNSIIRLAQKMDTGVVLAMSEVAIGELETTGELHDRLAADGAQLMLRVVEDLANDRATEAAQDDSRASLAPKIKRELAQIDWTRPADEIARKIRGLHPWPGCRVRLVSERKDGLKATLVRARPRHAQNVVNPGEIDSSGAIAAADGAVEIIELQPEGSRIMSLAEFRNGHPWTPGMRVESI